MGKQRIGNFCIKETQTSRDNKQSNDVFFKSLKQVSYIYNDSPQLRTTHLFCLFFSLSKTEINKMTVESVTKQKITIPNTRKERERKQITVDREIQKEMYKNDIH